MKQNLSKLAVIRCTARRAREELPISLYKHLPGNSKLTTSLSLTAVSTCQTCTQSAREEIQAGESRILTAGRILVYTPPSHVRTSACTISSYEREFCGAVFIECQRPAAVRNSWSRVTLAAEYILISEGRTNLAPTEE